MGGGIYAILIDSKYQELLNKIENINNILQCLYFIKHINKPHKKRNENNPEKDINWISVFYRERCVYHELFDKLDKLLLDANVYLDCPVIREKKYDKWKFVFGKCKLFCRKCNREILLNDIIIKVKQDKSTCVCDTCVCDTCL